MQKRRAVGGIRLSSLTEETTSPQRQRELDQQWAEANDTDIIAWAEDLDVSAKIAPWDRPELGPWLTPEAMQTYEVLIFAKLDRAVRSLNDFVDLDRLCVKHNVSLVILDPPIDLTDMWGRALAQILAVFAELERKMIGKRIKEGHAAVVQAGRWPGGRVPWGYRPIQLEDKDGWFLVLDEEKVPLIKDIVEQIISGKSLQSQCDRLTELGIPTSSGKGRWQAPALGRILRSRTMIGQWPIAIQDPMSPRKDVARDEKGIPIQRAEPIIDYPVWQKLQDVLKRRAGGRGGVRRNGAPLLRVAFCGICDGDVPMYRRLHRKRKASHIPKDYEYYRCADQYTNDEARRIHKGYPAPLLEEIVFEAFLERVGPLEVQEKVYVPGEDHTETLLNAQVAYGELSEQYAMTKSVSGRKRLREQLSALDAQIAELETKPSRPPGWRYEGVGQTYNELWTTLDDQERGALLRETGVSARVAHTEDTGQVVVALVLPENLEEQAQVWASVKEWVA